MKRTLLIVERIGTCFNIAPCNDTYRSHSLLIYVQIQIQTSHINKYRFIRDFYGLMLQTTHFSSKLSKIQKSYVFRSRMDYPNVELIGSNLDIGSVYIWYQIISPIKTQPFFTCLYLQKTKAIMIAKYLSQCRQNPNLSYQPSHRLMLQFLKFC